MDLQIGQREQEGIVILDLKGPLILGLQDCDLRERLYLLAAEGKITVALNLEKVSRIDSTGLGMLVFAHVTLKKAGGFLTLFNLQPSHLDLLLLTKLATVFELFTNELDAVNGCFPDREVKHYDILSFVQHGLVAT
jgi:anti-sigma B factor antagonist